MLPAITRPTSSALLCLFCAAFLYISCKPKPQWHIESEQLTHQVEQWNQRYEALNHQVDSLWDTTSLQLAEALPADFPATDRDIFIRARNADHILMFMSYKKLDADLQRLVTDAGLHDARLAEALRQLYHDRSALDDAISSFLVRVSHADPASGYRYVTHFASLNTIAALQ
jgi:hypothetical protein